MLCRKKIWVILNAPFTIWALSAIVLTIISHLYVETQNCMADANRIIEKYDRISLELENRLRDNYQAIINAKTVAELKSADEIKNQLNRYTYVEFKGRTLDDLFDEYRKLRIRIKFTNFNEETGNYEVIPRSNKKFYRGDENDEIITSILTPIRNGYKNLSDSEFKELKITAPETLEFILSVHKENARMLKNIDCNWNEITQ